MRTRLGLPRRSAAGSGAAASARGSHSLAVGWDGTLWALGGNATDQLGNGGTAISAEPVQIW